MIEKSLRRYTDLFERMDAVITPEAAFRVFQQLADTYAPTLTARYTRGLRIQRILEDMKGVGSLRDKLLLDLNFRKTGNVAITLGTQEVKPILACAAGWRADGTGQLNGNRTRRVTGQTGRHRQGARDAYRTSVRNGW